MTVMEMANQYYPAYWSAERIDALVAAGRLTKAQAKEIKGGGGDNVSGDGNAAETD